MLKKSLENVQEISEDHVSNAELSIRLCQSPLSVFKVDLAHANGRYVIASLTCGLEALMSG